MLKSKEHVKGYVNIYKSRGKFYYVYSTDAVLMSHVLDYKLLEGIRVGFPDNAIERVKEKLSLLKISYVVYNIDEKPLKKNFHKKNMYNFYLTEANKNLDIKLRTDRIIDKIKKCDKDKLRDLLGVIDDFFRE